MKDEPKEYSGFAELEQFLISLDRLLNNTDAGIRRLSASTLLALYTDALLKAEQAKESERNALRELGSMMMEQEPESKPLEKPKVRVK